MPHTLLTFLPAAALLWVTRGAATALVVRDAARAGRRYASALAMAAVARARRTFVDGGWGRRVERLTGAVLTGLGIRLALERH